MICVRYAGQEIKTVVLPQIFLQELQVEIDFLCSWIDELVAFEQQPELLLKLAYCEEFEQLSF